MADLVFNIAKGKVAYYATLPAASDALIAVPIETSGIVSDATMKDYDNLSDLLAGASNEQTTMGRKTLASVTVSTDDTNDWTYADAADITWAAATGNAVSALVICYAPDTGASTDTDLIPLVKLDFVATPSGGDIVFAFSTGGFYRAS